MTTTIEDTMKMFQKAAVLVGVVLYLAGVKVSKRRMLNILFIGNFLLSVP